MRCSGTSGSGTYFPIAGTEISVAQCHMWPWWASRGRFLNHAPALADYQSMELVDINGIGPVTAELLTQAGLATVASVANADPAILANIRGIGPVTAESIRAEATELLDTATSGPVEDVSSAAEETNAGASKSERRGHDLRKRAKKLRKQAKQQAAKANSASSKKKRKRLKNKAAQLDASAKKARRKAKKLLAK